MTSLQVTVGLERGECYGLYRCDLIIFRHELNHNWAKLSRLSYIRFKKIKGATILCNFLMNIIGIS